jgi:hypothetical protein
MFSQPGMLRNTQWILSDCYWVGVRSCWLDTRRTQLIPFTRQISQTLRGLFMPTPLRLTWPNRTPIIVGRGRPDTQMLLALAAFPFLEGMARRRLPTFMDEWGVVLTAFSIGSKTYKPSARISNLGHTLHLLERENASDDFRVRMSTLRQAIRLGALADEIRAISADEDDLYGIIFAHRNSNVHGGRQLIHAGIGALLLATIIGLDAIRDQFDDLRDTAQMVSISQAPADPKELWPHYIFYPVPFSHSYETENVHCWPSW